MNVRRFSGRRCIIHIAGKIHMYWMKFTLHRGSHQAHEITKLLPFRIAQLIDITSMFACRQITRSESTLVLHQDSTPPRALCRIIKQCHVIVRWIANNIAYCALRISNHCLAFQRFAHALTRREYRIDMFESFRRIIQCITKSNQCLERFVARIQLCLDAAVLPSINDWHADFV